MSAYIEVDHGDQPIPFSDTVQIYSLTEGSFSFSGYNYDAFDALEYGREASAAPEDRDPLRAPLFAPRGMPSPCSLAVGWDYYYAVADPPELPDRYFWPQRRCVTSAEAHEWLEKKGCHEAKFLQWFNCEPEGKIWRVVSEANLYNATWLHIEEFDASLAHHELNIAALPIEYRVIRSALSLLGEKYGNERVRLVIWFS
jgi:hypothetical protein